MTDKEYGYPGLDMSVDITGTCECGHTEFQHGELSGQCLVGLADDCCPCSLFTPRPSEPEAVEVEWKCCWCGEELITGANRGVVDHARCINQQCPLYRKNVFDAPNARANARPPASAGDDDAARDAAVEKYFGTSGRNPKRFIDGWNAAIAHVREKEGKSE